jgi:hypothetical protein
MIPFHTRVVCHNTSKRFTITFSCVSNSGIEWIEYEASRLREAERDVMNFQFDGIADMTIMTAMVDTEGVQIATIPL